MNFLILTSLLVICQTLPPFSSGVPVSISDSDSTIFGPNSEFKDVMTRNLGKMRHSEIKVAPIVIDNFLLGLLFPDWQELEVIPLLNATFDFQSNLIRGQYSSWNSTIRGIPTLSEKFSYEFLEDSFQIPLNIQFDLASFTLGGGYESDLNLLNGGIFFSGEGLTSVHVENVSLSVGLRLTQTADPSIIVDNFQINFGFKKLYIVADNSLINCLEPHWDEIAFDIKVILATYWPMVNDILKLLVEPILNDLLKTCDINVIINEQDLSCIGEVVPDVGQVWTKFTKMIEELKPMGKPRLANPCVNDNVRSLP